MKLINTIFTVFLIIYAENNLCLGKSLEESLTIESKSNNLIKKSLNLSENLCNFLQKNPEVNNGTNTIAEIYNSREDPEAVYEGIKDRSIPKSIAFYLGLLVNGTCGVIKPLSIYYKELLWTGQTLTGLYIGKSILWGIYSYISNSAKRSSLDTINALQTDNNLPC